MCIRDSRKAPCLYSSQWAFHRQKQVFQISSCFNPPSCFSVFFVLFFTISIVIADESIRQYGFRTESQGFPGISTAGFYKFSQNFSAFPAFPEGKFRMPLNSCHKPFSRHFYCFNQTIRPHSRSFKNWSQLDVYKRQVLPIQKKQETYHPNRTAACCRLGYFFHFLFARIPLERSRCRPSQPYLHHGLMVFNMVLVGFILSAYRYDLVTAEPAECTSTVSL